MTSPAPLYVETETLLFIEDVSLSFGWNLVLRDVNAVIHNVTRPGCTVGQIVGLLGPSGCGKSTLLRIITGLGCPDAVVTGQVLLGEKRTPATRGMVGMVSQSCTLRRNRTVYGNLLIAAHQHDVHAKDADFKAQDMLMRFGLINTKDQYPSQLSGGQRQRIAIAQQLLCSDHFLVMDEPFAALDYTNIQKTLALIQEVANADDLNTIIVVTHDIESALAISDHLWIMGRERDGGNVFPGARIVQELDLLREGLCWTPDVTHLPRFTELKREIQEMFDLL